MGDSDGGYLGSEPVVGKYTLSSSFFLADPFSFFSIHKYIPVAYQANTSKLCKFSVIHFGIFWRRKSSSRWATTRPLSPTEWPWVLPRLQHDNIKEEQRYRGQQWRTIDFPPNWGFTTKKRRWHLSRQLNISSKTDPSWHSALPITLHISCPGCPISLSKCNFLSTP